MQDGRVVVSLPLNLSKEDLSLFDGKQTYELSTLKVLELKDAFITHMGLCLVEKKLIKESHHDDPKYFPSFQAQAFSSYFKAQYNKSKLITLNDDNTYLLIHNPWYNYYHWLSEAIPRLWLVKERLKELILILPERCKYDDWVLQSVAPFHFKDIFFIPNGKSIFVRNLCMPQIKPNCHSYFRKDLLEIKSFYLSKIKDLKPINLYGKKIYISRKHAKKRHISNNSEIEKLLNSRGYSVIYNEEHSFFEQIMIFAQANELLSIHGAGLTNMIWMNTGSTIFELHKKKTNNKDRHSLVYWFLADALGHNYLQQVCDPVKPSDDFFSADLIVDPGKLEQNLDYIARIVGN